MNVILGKKLKLNLKWNISDTAGKFLYRLYARIIFLLPRKLHVTSIYISKQRCEFDAASPRL